MKNKKAISCSIVCIGTVIIILLNIRKYIITKNQLIILHIFILAMVFVANIAYYKYYDR